MDIEFKPISKENINQALAIYNWYVLNSTATFHLDVIASEELEQMVSIGHYKYRSYLIFHGGEACGFCYLSQFRYKEAYDKSAEITLYLDKEFAGKGIGKKTITCLEKVAKSSGINNLIAVITAHNLVSISLFEKYGYFKVGHLKNIGIKFGKALDVVSYQKEI